MAKYRKKPVEIEAWQIGSDEPWPDWLEDAIYVKQTVEIRNNRWIVHTLEGDHLARKHDYIIRGVQGELYPCKPDIFKQTYEVVLDD